MILCKYNEKNCNIERHINSQETPDFADQFVAKDCLRSQPLKGVRVGVIRETLGDGVDTEVISSIQSAVAHLDDLGCAVTEVCFIICCFFGSKF